MKNLRVEYYAHHVVNHKPQDVPACLFRYWGAIGDFYYWLTFAAPLLRKKSAYKRVLAADGYARYGPNNPLLELLHENGLVDELWLHPRSTGGVQAMPQEMLECLQDPKQGWEIYDPGIYAVQFRDKGAIAYPLDWMREEARREEKYLIPAVSRESVCALAPELSAGYMTVQLYSSGKKRNSQIPMEHAQALSSLPIQKVVLEFPNDIRMPEIRNSYKLRDWTFVKVSNAVHALRILAHAACHVGVESSQLLGAGIQDVRCFYWPFNPGLTIFERDLNLTSLWSRMDWDEHPSSLAHKVEAHLWDTRMSTV